MIKKILFLLFLIQIGGLTAQEANYGVSFGVTGNLGTITKRIGIFGAAYYAKANLQGNLSAKCFYNFKSLGTQAKGFEVQLGLGLQLGFGAYDTDRNNFISITDNNTYRDYALGYALMYYLDQSKTTQTTGILSFNVKNFNIINENDLFGNLFNQKDRFRTGAFLIQYQYEDIKFGINATLWTDDYADGEVILDENSRKWTRFGYYEAKNGQKLRSLGLFSFQMDGVLPFHQACRFNIGIDSEKVRNGIQNKFVHDQPFVPNALVWRKPPHIPMTTVTGDQYIYGDGQKIRPGKFYFDFSLNPTVFY